MKTTTKHQSFLATSSKKYFKFGLLGAFAITIAAFKMPLYSSPPNVKIESRIDEEKDWVINSIIPIAENNSLPKIEQTKIVHAFKIVSVDFEPPAIDNPIDEKKITEELVMPTEKQIKETEIERSNEPEIRDYAEVMPKFKGGEKAMYDFVYNNIYYNPLAIENDIQGKVYVKFVINTYGEVVNAKVVKGVDKLLDREALKVVQNMPKWDPGFQNGELVNVSIVLPINFVLKN